MKKKNVKRVSSAQETINENSSYSKPNNVNISQQCSLFQSDLTSFKFVIQVDETVPRRVRVMIFPSIFILRGPLL